MAAPVNDFYSASSGVVIYIGRTNLPLWAQGKPLNEWFTISGTSGAGGSAVNAYSGFAVTPSGQIVVAAAGGHTDSSDNRVVSLDLSVGAPSWTTRKAASSPINNDQAYNPDGTPASRHLYHQIQYVAALQRVMLIGCRFTYPNASTFLTVDGFNLSTNAWDAAGTYANIPAMNGGAVVDGNGDVWAANCARKYTVANNTWSSPLTQTAANAVRYPWAWDSTRSQLFGLCFGDGEGAGNGQVNAVKQSGTVQTQVTFNASAALTQFQADAPAYAGMDYDPVNDCFLFYAGASGAAGRMYKIKPNSSSVWDMEIFNYGAGSVTPAAAAGGGALSRFRYVASLRGFVLLPAATSNIHFIRTA